MRGNDPAGELLAAFELFLVQIFTIKSLNSIFSFILVTRKWLGKNNASVSTATGVIVHGSWVHSAETRSNRNWGLLIWFAKVSKETKFFSDSLLGCEKYENVHVIRYRLSPSGLRSWRTTDRIYNHQECEENTEFWQTFIISGRNVTYRRLIYTTNEYQSARSSFIRKKTNCWISYYQIVGNFPLWSKETVVDFDANIEYLAFFFEDISFMYNV